MNLLQRFRKKKTLLTQNITPPSSGARVIGFLSIVIWLGALAMVLITIGNLHTKTKSEDPIKSELTRLFSDKKHVQEEDKGSDDFLDTILPKSNVQEDYLDSPEKTLFTERKGDPGFPPGGDKLLSLRGFVFFENQRRYEPVRLELIQWGNSVYLAGAGMCEVVQSKYVLLKPCIFREQMISDLDTKTATSYEIEMIKSINFFLTSQFEPYARHITSTLMCDSINKYKITVQYLNTSKDGYISINVPFSVSEVDAYGDLLKEEKLKCSGIDIFFDPESVLLINTTIESARKKIIKLKGNSYE
jgi:hypothetical protein